MKWGLKVANKEAPICSGKKNYKVIFTALWKKRLIIQTLFSLAGSREFLHFYRFLPIFHFNTIQVFSRLPPGWPVSRASFWAWRLMSWSSPLLKTLLDSTLWDSGSQGSRLFTPAGVWTVRLGSPSNLKIMGIQDMELLAIGVVVILFMAVLKQFGILEPISSFEGKGQHTWTLPMSKSWS